MKKILYLVMFCLSPVYAQAQSLFVSQPSMLQIRLKSVSEQKKLDRKLDELNYKKKLIEAAQKAEFSKQQSLKKQLTQSGANNAGLELLGTIRSRIDSLPGGNSPAIVALRNDLTRQWDSLQKHVVTVAEFSAGNRVLDSLDDAAAGLKEATDTSGTGIAASLKALNKMMPWLSISGIGGISELQKPDQSGGNFTAQATFRLSKYKRIGKSNWVDPLFLYMSFNTRTGASSDSAKLTKLFLFPNISKRDFVIGVYWRFQHLPTDWNIEPIVEFSLNRYKGTRDSVDYGFGSESALLGVRFSKVQQFGDTAFEAGFVLFPYYSLINVQPKNYHAYETLLKGALPYTVHTLGLQAVLQLSKVQLFADMKYILNRHSSNINVDDFRGFTYTIGTMVAVDVLRLRLTGRDD